MSEQVKRSWLAPAGWSSVGALVAGALVLGGPWVVHKAAHVECDECDARAVRAVARQIQAEREQIQAANEQRARAQAAPVSSGGDR